MLLLVGSLSAKKWVKCYFPDKSTKLAGMVGKGLRSNILMAPSWLFIILCFMHLFKMAAIRLV